MKDLFHNFGERRWMTVCSCVAMLVFGVLLLAHPENITNLLLNLSGGLMIALGALRVVSYFFSDALEAVQERKLASGLLLLLAGLAMIAFKGLLIAIVPLLLGAVIFVGGAIRLQGALDMRRLKVGHSLPVLLSAIVSIIMGVVIVSDPFESLMALLRVIGAALIVETIMDAVYSWQFHRWMDELHRRFH